MICSILKKRTQHRRLRETMALNQSTWKLYRNSKVCVMAIKPTKILIFSFHNKLDIPLTIWKLSLQIQRFKWLKSSLLMTRIIFLQILNTSRMTQFSQNRISRSNRYEPRKRVKLDWKDYQITFDKDYLQTKRCPQRGIEKWANIMSDFTAWIMWQWKRQEKLEGKESEVRIRVGSR